MTSTAERKASACRFSSAAIAENGNSINSLGEQTMCDEYLVSRNGVILPWEEIHEKYPLDNKNNIRSSCSTQPDQCLPIEASELLQRLPRGAYTTCRTVKNGTHIYQFDYHVKRLAVSSASILDSISTKQHQTDMMSSSAHPRQHHRNPSECEAQNMKIINEDWERDMALNCIRLTLNAFRSLHLNNDQNGSINNLNSGPEFRITLLATWEQNHKDDFKSVLYCHIGQLANYSTSKIIRVLVHGHGRDNAAAKDSKWVTDRKQLMASNGYEEIILINNKGEILEGTQTNFYVVKNSNTIITANEGVLFGSVRDSVLRVCREHDIEVQLRPPTPEDLKRASGVFITSTSRWVMPVHEVDLGDLLQIKSDSSNIDEPKETNSAGVSAATTYRYENCQTTKKIRKWVIDDVETHSTLIPA